MRKHGLPWAELLRRVFDNDVHKLLKTIAAVGIALTAAVLLLRSAKTEEHAAPKSASAASDAQTETAMLRSPAGYLPATPRLPGASGASPTVGGEELSQEEQAALAECWSECGAPCTGSESGESTCPSECEEDDQCKADELCLPTRMTTDGTRRKRCLTDQCSGIGADSDCGPDATCRFVSRLEGNIYICAQAGRRSTGEPCGHSEFDDIGLCDVGLHCLNGECSPLSCEVDGDCGATARCFGFAGGMRQCVPFCEADSDCPDTTICNTQREIGHCVAPETMGCLRTGCDEGSACVVHSSSAYLSVTSCMQACDASSECGEGLACGNTQDALTPACYQRCDQNTPCEEGWICGEPGLVSLDDDSSPAMCVRDTKNEIDRFFRKHDKQPDDTAPSSAP